MSNPLTQAKQYILFFCIEVAGMLLLLWDGLPIYRHLMMLEQVATGRDEAIMWVAVLAMQISYWKVLRHEAPFALPRQPLVAHIILFLSRLSFVFASSLFVLVVYRNFDSFNFSPNRTVLFIAILFSVFCFSRHLEAIGSLMLKGRQ